MIIVEQQDEVELGYIFNFIQILFIIILHCHFSLTKVSSFSLHLINNNNIIVTQNTLFVCII